MYSLGNSTCVDWGFHQRYNIWRSRTQIAARLAERNLRLWLRCISGCFRACILFAQTPLWIRRKGGGDCGRCTPFFLDLALSLSHTIQTGQLATVQRFLLAAPHRRHEQNPAHSHSSEEADWSGRISTNLKENPNFHHTKQMQNVIFHHLRSHFLLSINDENR